MNDEPIHPVEGFSGYWITELGNVFSTRRKGLYKLKPCLDQDGYPHVNLMRNGKHHTLKVQRLVALHFLGPKPDGMVVCHNNGNKLDCSVYNLRYDTQASNIADIYLHGNENPPRGSVNGMSKLIETDILEMRRLYVTEKLSKAELGRRFNISREQARDIINRKSWKHI